MYEVFVFFALGCIGGDTISSCASSSSSISDISDSEEGSFCNNSCSPAAANCRSNCRTINQNELKSLFFSLPFCNTSIAFVVKISRYSTHFVRPTGCFVALNHRYQIDGLYFFASWMLCIRLLFSKFALDSPAKYIVQFSPCRKKKNKTGFVNICTLTSIEALTTFSPCKDGTASRSAVKLSFMWSRLFRSSALWWARFSAYEKNEKKKPK